MTAPHWWLAGVRAAEIIEAHVADKRAARSAAIAWRRQITTRHGVTVVVGPAGIRGLRASTIGAHAHLSGISSLQAGRVFTPRVADPEGVRLHFAAREVRIPGQAALFARLFRPAKRSPDLVWVRYEQHGGAWFINTRVFERPVDSVWLSGAHLARLRGSLAEAEKEAA